MLHKIKNHKATKIAAKVLGIKIKLLLFIILPFVIITLLMSQTDFIRGYKSFIVVSGSMEPHVPVGSIVYTKQLGTYQKDEVISFKNDKDQTITHRIVQVENKNGVMMFQTKGDANNVTDSELTPTAKVLGKVFFQVPYVGRIIAFIKTPLGFGLLIILPTVIFILSELWVIKKEIEKEVEKKVLSRIKNIPAE